MPSRKRISILIGSTLTILGLLASPLPAQATESVESLVAKKAASIEILHRKAGKALVNAAQDRNFAGYFQASDSDQREHHKQRVDQISLSVQERFHVEEMCLIDPEGAELSRIVGREIADDLSQDEASAIFFDPGFALSARRLHISATYMSPDANRWVVAYVTPVVVEGDKRAILHYEHGLDFYHHILNQDLSDDGPYLLAVDRQGYLVSDSRRSLAIERKDESEQLADYFERFALAGLDLQGLIARLGGGPAGAGTLDGEDGTLQVAYRQVEDWTLLAVTQAP